MTFPRSCGSLRAFLVSLKRGKEPFPRSCEALSPFGVPSKRGKEAFPLFRGSLNRGKAAFPGFDETPGRSEPTTSRLRHSPERAKTSFPAFSGSPEGYGQRPATSLMVCSIILHSLWSGAQTCASEGRRRCRPPR